MKNADFNIENTGRELFLIPNTVLGKKICKDYKGVIMRKFTVNYSNFDQFIKSYNTKFNVCIVTCDI